MRCPYDRMEMPMPVEPRCGTQNVMFVISWPLTRVVSSGPGKLLIAIVLCTLSINAANTVSGSKQVRNEITQ